MRGVYTAAYRISALSTARTLMYITVDPTKVVEILSASVTNESNESSEQLLCGFQRISALGTPTATVVTPGKHETGDQAAISVVHANVIASEPTYPAILQNANMPGAFGLEGFPSLGGWYHTPIPEERLMITPGDSWGLRMVTVPTPFDAVVRWTFREIG